MKTRSEQIIARAGAAGSTATTVVGAAKYLLAHRQPADKPTDPAALRARYHQHRTLDTAQPGDAIMLKDPLTQVYRWEGLDSSTLALDSRNSARRNHPRKQNIRPGAARVTGSANQERWETINYRGHFKGWRGSEIYCDYQSCVGVTRSGRSAVIVQGCRLVRRIIAPSDLRFERDANGLLVRRTTDGMDYHPTDEDWTARDFWTRVRRGMAAAYLARRAAAREERKNARAIASAEKRGVRVGLEDSLASGNCEPGTRNFAARHGLDIRRWYQPSVLMAAANGDSQRVRLAIACAVQRHDRWTSIPGVTVYYPA